MAPTRNTMALLAAVAAVAALAAGCSSAESTGSATSTASAATSRIDTPTGQFVLEGAILQKYDEADGSSGPLGYPVTDEETIPGGWRSSFEHGTITYTNGQPYIQTT